MPYDLHALQKAERDRAFVLVHLMKPEVDLARWRAFLREVENQRTRGIERGITVAALEGECLVGLYSWATQPSLEHEKVFTVDNFMATGALDPEPLFDAMIGEMEAQAKNLGCAAMQVSVPNLYTSSKQQRLLHDSFLVQGFIVAGQKLRRTCDTSSAVHAECGGAPGDKSPDALH